MRARWSSALASAAAIAILAPVVSAQTVSRTGAESPLPPGPPPAVQAGPPATQPLYAPAYAPPCGCAEAPRPAPFTPFMLGDFIGPVANLFSDVKIAEGESPRPTDRIFYRFNYYNNIDQSDARDRRNSFHNVNLYQSVFGMEKTFFDQKVSLGLRVPFYTMSADGKDFIVTDATGAPTIQHGDSFTATEFGNLAAVVKAVLWEDRETGSLLSGGATPSFPTASSRRLNLGQSILAYAQPYAGFIVQRGDFFVQGFSSITLPLARAESIVLFNDIGVGYYLYRDRSGAGLLRGIAPTAEVHVATPLR
jgi:hypothetical protein